MPDTAGDTIQSLTLAYQHSPGIACEGRVRWMYLDTAGLVTVGTGEMLPNVAAACALPFKRLDGTPATAAEITAVFEHVHAMPASHLATFYKMPLELDDAAIDQLTAAKCHGFIGQLQGVFPAFLQFPPAAQLALLDMTFNLGIGRAPTPAHQGTGLQEFTHLCASVRARDWASCAQQCARDSAMPAFAARNNWTRQQFLAAAGKGA